ncbi:penicillin acylase family protein [Lysobacter sp. CA199]|uniref:penicillin acylase family protein n=1 Tax=Lysobacter sp. CA199 TaxID=3455608 RepID=UPI003F8CF96A
MRIAAVVIAVFALTLSLAPDASAQRAQDQASPGQSSPGQPSQDRPAQQRTQLRVSGLAEPVEILRDRWGIAHIYAKNEDDLFFAQGYNAARDRLFQFELWRRQATGTTAEVFGRKELKRDIGARLHQFRGDMKRELALYHPRGERIVGAFVRGVNAYVGQTERDPSLLPLEFGLLGIKPGRWTAEVVVSRHQGLLANLAQEIELARAVAALGAQRVRTLGFFQGGEPVLQPDPAIDLAAIPDDVLELYKAFRDPMSFAPEQIADGHRAPSGATAPTQAALAQAAAEIPNPLDVGSNNWVIHGSRTQGTFPIMANDPHRAQSAPSLRYWVHLVAPGWNVIGAGEPVLPGVSIGHNEYGAWGLTIFGNDSEDLYVYQTHPDDPDQYRYRGRWETMRTVKDSIAVKGEAPVAVEYKYTRHGPVLFQDKARHTAYALRAAWMEPGSAPYLASLRMDQARTWEEFRQACAFNRIPAENMVWADRKGNIGYQAAGIQPRRRNWSGLLPVPGDGRYEWDGYHPTLDLPNAHNPASGYLVTANHYLMPNDYAWPEAMHYTWADPYRAARITELLGSGRLYSVAEVARLQNDDVSIPARSLVPLLRGVALSGARAEQARDQLLAWDYALDKDSVTAGIYAMWQRRLIANVRATMLPEKVTLFISMKRIIDWLLAPGGEFGDDPTQARDALLARSLHEAVAELSTKLGPDMKAWRYGQEKYHHALIRHPLANAVDAATRARLNVGPVPRGGDSYTVSATGGDDNQLSGGSFKIVTDTEDWDNSIGQNTPGQSGDPDSRHYRDLFAMWSQGKYFPVAYSREKVEGVTAEAVMLLPADSAQPATE